MAEETSYMKAESLRRLCTLLVFELPPCATSSERRLAVGNAPVCCTVQTRQSAVELLSRNICSSC